jgi:hypothetical protein
LRRGNPEKSHPLHSPISRENWIYPIPSSKKNIAYQFIQSISVVIVYELGILAVLQEAQARDTRRWLLLLHHAPQQKSSHQLEFAYPTPRFFANASYMAATGAGVGSRATGLSLEFESLRPSGICLFSSLITILSRRLQIALAAAM